MKVIVTTTSGFKQHNALLMFGDRGVLIAGDDYVGFYPWASIESIEIPAVEATSQQTRRLVLGQDSQRI